MEQAGVKFDLPYLAEMSQRLDEALKGLERQAHEHSGGYGDFNLSSPKQLNDVLFGKLGLPRQGIPKTAHGNSTAANILEKLWEQSGHPILKSILEYRELSKLKGTYVDALPALVNAVTGRVHTSFNQAGSSTGRISSSNPNLQNIPIRTEIGREVRRAVIAEEGNVLLSVDYSQVELRIMAHMADEPYLQKAFMEGQDIHRATGALIFDTTVDAISSDQRSFAKRINFGLLYGMGRSALRVIVN
jgi:DNA polymerase-1